MRCALLSILRASTCLIIGELSFPFTFLLGVVVFRGGFLGPEFGGFLLGQGRPDAGLRSHRHAMGS